MLFAANLTTMFCEHAFLDRFEAARRAGFSAVECQFPYDHRAEVIAAKLCEHDLQLIMFNTPPGDQVRGELGLAALPGCQARFQDSVEHAIGYCHATGTRLLHVLAGRVAASAESRAAFETSLIWAAERVSDDGIDLLIEPLAPITTPGYFLNSFDVAAEVIATVALNNVRLLFDIYQRQRCAGDVIAGLRAHLPLIGHVQLASVPERHEPGSGELDDAHILAELRQLNYSGAIGCEYHPAGDTVEGLGWMRTLLSEAVGTTRNLA